MDNGYKEKNQEMMLQHEFTMRENLRFSDDGGNEDKSCLGMSLPNVVSGGSDTFVIDSTTVSKKKRRTILKIVRRSAIVNYFSLIPTHLILLSVCIIFLQIGQ